MIKIIIIYTIIINIIGFFSMLIDKRRAIKNKWRIPEKTLFLIAIIGGSVGSIAGMRLFRHKTKHWYFAYGMPAILLVQIVIISLLLGKYYL
ncbi:MAG: DUF1294 domain-containing protein [Lachnospiraceae bacterium]|nr:DUF1294 domain-containing protein [Lachnospiraceae bacterium]